MALVVALFSAKGSPGATTLGEALVAVMSRAGSAVLVELDPDGGDRAVAPGLSLQPGLTTLAAAGRHGALSEDVFVQHLQELPAGGQVLVGPASAVQAHAALASIVPSLAPAFAAFETGYVVADCGRMRSRSPALDVARHATVAIVVTRPTLDGVEHARERVAGLDDLGARTRLVLVGRQPYGPDEVARALGVPVLGVLAHDHGGAQLVRAGQAVSRAGRRSFYMRSVGTLMGALMSDRAMPTSVGA